MSRTGRRAGRHAAGDGSAGASPGARRQRRPRAARPPGARRPARRASPARRGLRVRPKVAVVVRAAVSTRPRRRAVAPIAARVSASKCGGGSPGRRDPRRSAPAGAAALRRLPEVRDRRRARPRHGSPGSPRPAPARSAARSRGGRDRGSARTRPRRSRRARPPRGRGRASAGRARRRLERSGRRTASTGARSRAAGRRSREAQAPCAALGGERRLERVVGRVHPDAQDVQLALGQPEIEAAGDGVDLHGRDELDARRQRAAPGATSSR